MSAPAPSSQEQHFDAVAGDYDEAIAAHVMEHLTRRRVRLARELAPVGARLLDVGCGTGTFLEALGTSFEATGVDVSDAMLERARARGLTVERSSAAELPFEDATFDLVTTFAVLHHLIDRDVVRSSIREMCRVVRPGGAVLVSDHNPLNPYWPLLMRRVPQDRGDERLVPARLIRDELQRSGMLHVRVRRMTFTPDFTPPAAMGAMARIEGQLERVPLLRLLGAHNVVTARRRA